MNKRHHRRNKRRHIIREQLTDYGPAADQEIPYSDQYTQFMVTERNCKPATAKINLKKVKEFSRFLKLEYGLETFDPLSIEPSHLRRYLSYLKKERGNNTGTRNNKLSALKSYYFFLECFEYIEEDQNPTLLIRKSRDHRRLPIVLSLEEIEALLKVSGYGRQGKRNLAILRLMLQTALRVEEVVRLQVYDVDIFNKTLLVQGKGNRERVAPLTDNTCKALKEYFDVRQPSDPKDLSLFLNIWGEPLNGREFYLIFKELCQQAGLKKPGLSVRHLRHTSLTLLMQSGADILALKKLAGHKTLKSTQLYLRISQTQLREAMKKHPFQ